MKLAARVWIGLTVAVLSATVGSLAAPALSRAANECGIPPDTKPFAGSPRVESVTVDGTRVNVLLPSDYGTSARSSPVLYLLHGGTDNEDSWLSATDIERFTARFTGPRAAIVVMPEGELFGIDVDWRDGQPHWESLYVDELIPYIDAHFRTLGDRADRAIAGLSGGGFSAMHIAARHPDLFVAAGSFSGFLGFDYMSPVAEAAGFPVFYLDQVCQAHDLAGPGVFGDPVTDDVWWHNASPADLAPNLRDLSLYVSAGNGVPCSAADLSSGIQTGGPLSFLEVLVRRLSKDFGAALDRVDTPHRDDYFPCGIHDFPNFQRELHRFWPQMVAAFGMPPPSGFDYRRADPDFSVWGWNFRADPSRAAEFLEIHQASASGLTLSGSGGESVTTAAYFASGQQVEVRGAGDGPFPVTADAAGRIGFEVDLGPPHGHQQYTAGARLAGAGAPGYFTTRSVELVPR